MSVWVIFDNINCGILSHVQPWNIIPCAPVEYYSICNWQILSHAQPWNIILCAHVNYYLMCNCGMLSHVQLANIIPCSTMEYYPMCTKSCELLFDVQLQNVIPCATMKYYLMCTWIVVIMFKLFNDKNSRFNSLLYKPVNCYDVMIYLCTYIFLRKLKCRFNFRFDQSLLF